MNKIKEKEKPAITCDGKPVTSFRSKFTIQNMNNWLNAQAMAIHDFLASCKNGTLTAWPVVKQRITLEGWMIHVHSNIADKGFIIDDEVLGERSSRFWSEMIRSLRRGHLEFYKK